MFTKTNNKLQFLAIPVFTRISLGIILCCFKQEELENRPDWSTRSDKNQEEDIPSPFIVFSAPRIPGIKDENHFLSVVPLLLWAETSTSRGYTLTPRTEITPHWPKTHPCVNVPHSSDSYTLLSTSHRSPSFHTSDALLVQTGFKPVSTCSVVTS